MNSTNTADFISGIYHQPIPEKSQILIWTLPDKKSYWLGQDTGKLITLAEKLVKEEKDVYIGVGLAPSGIKSTLRARADQIVALPAFWLDIDFKDPVHVKKNLPSEVEAIIFIRDEITPPPTFVIHTGHGFHLWWTLDKPMLLKTAEDKEHATGLLNDFSEGIKAKMKVHQWTLDSTFDLARVLRLPGTTNFKNDPLEVHIKTHNDVTYTIDQLSSPHVERPKRKQNPISLPGIDSELKLDPEASPSMFKWMMLQENEPKAIRSWSRTRRDFDDQSASTYDLSLASMAAYAGWEDQEIVDLLIASRRHHGDDLKLREDYYAKTLAKAKSTSPKLADKQLDKLDRDDEEAVKQTVSDIMGVTISRLVKFEGDPPSYVLEVVLGERTTMVTLGGVETILEQRLFRAKIAATADIIIPKCTPAQWEKKASLLMSMITVEQLGPDSTPAGAVMAWISEYLEMYRPSHEPDEAIKANRPYFLNGYLHVFLRPFAFWLKTNQGERMTNRELARYLRMAGFEQFTQFVKESIDESATTRSIWRGKVSL